VDLCREFQCICGTSSCIQIANLSFADAHPSSTPPHIPLDAHVLRRHHTLRYRTCSKPFLPFHPFSNYSTIGPTSEPHNELIRCSVHSGPDRRPQPHKAVNLILCSCSACSANSICRIENTWLSDSYYFFFLFLIATPSASRKLLFL